jgi:ATP-dependent DNA helicase HFM1/MER3
LIGGQQLVESSLHRNLAEHLNAEVVLQTITDLSMAMAWLKSTFLFVRALKNPKHYKLSPVNVEAQLKGGIHDFCKNNMQIF